MASGTPTKLPQSVKSPFHKRSECEHEGCKVSFFLGSGRHHCRVCFNSVCNVHCSRNVLMQAEDSNEDPSYFKIVCSSCLTKQGQRVDVIEEGGQSNLLCESYLHFNVNLSSPTLFLLVEELCVKEAEAHLTQEKLTLAEKSIQDLAASKEALEEENTRLRTQCVNFVTIVSDLEKQCRALQDECATLQSTDRVEEAVENTQSCVSVHEVGSSPVKDRGSVSHCAVSSAGEVGSVVQQQCASFRESEPGNIAADGGKNNELLNIYRHQIREMESAILNAEQKFSDSEALARNLRLAVASAELKASTSETRRTRTELQLQEASAQKLHLEDSLAVTQRMLAASESKNSLLQQQFAVAIEDSTALKSKAALVQELTGQLEVASLQLSAQKLQVQQMTASLEAVTTSSNSQLVQIAEFEKDIVSIRTKCTTAENEVETLKIQLAMVDEKLQLKEAEADQMAHAMVVLRTGMLKDKTKSLKAKSAAVATSPKATPWPEGELTYADVYNRRSSAFTYDESNSYCLDLDESNDEPNEAEA